MRFETTAAAIADLKAVEYDWDHAGGRAPTTMAWSATEEFLDWAKAMGMPTPEVGPTASGGVGVVWNREGYEAEFIIGPAGDEWVGIVEASD